MNNMRFRGVFTGFFVMVILFFTYAQSQTPVEKHGWLHTQGNLLLNENDNIVQLRGMSFFWPISNWYNECPSSMEQSYSAEMVRYLANDWGCTVVRAPYATDGEATGNNFQGENLVQEVVNAAMEEGIYVIIDWHSHNAHEQTSAAVSYFTQMAQEYKDVPNVIFEIYNEPVTAGNDIDQDDPGGEFNAVETWEEIKPYLTEVTREIRATGAKNLIIQGTPFYCQYVQVAADDPIVDNNGQPFENVAYSFHFYAASHGPQAHEVLENTGGNGQESSFLGEAINKVPIFVTEWGTTHSDGGRSLQMVDEHSTNWWFENYIDRYHLSWCNWSVYDCHNQSSAAFSNIGSRQLSSSGSLVKGLIHDEDEYEPIWKTGHKGPAKDTTFDMPSVHEANRYNRYWGSFVEAETVQERDPDNPLRFITTPVLSATQVTGSNDENWVTYQVNASTSTSKLAVNYKGEGSGTIEVYIDDEHAGDISISQNASWTTIVEEIGLSPGEHTIKLNFLNTTGTYYIKSIQFDNTVDAKRNLYDMAAVKSVTMKTLPHGFSVLLPSFHTYSSYSLVKANGQIFKRGSIKDNHPISFNNLAGGMWFLKLTGATGDKTIRAFVSGQ